MPQVLGDASIEHILTLIIVFMCSFNYIKNPYLTAKLVEVYNHTKLSICLSFFFFFGEYLLNIKAIVSVGQVLFVINPAVQRNTEKLNDMVLNHHLAMQYLVPALMNFYTGKYFKSTFTHTCTYK